MKTQKMIYAALLFAGLFFLASCQPVDFDGPQLAANSATAVQTYNVSIPAVFDDGAQTKAVEFQGESGISHTFTDDGSEGVIVYIPQKKAMAGVPGDPVQVYDYSIDNNKYIATFNPATLIPSDIVDGNHCTFEGELAFYTYDENGYYYDNTLHDWVYGKYNPYNPVTDDTYNLYYQPAQDDTYRFGSALVGFAEALGVSMNKDGNTLTLKGSVPFTNVGSIFRQKVSFTAGGESVTTPAVQRFIIYTAEASTIAEYNPFGKEEIYGPYHMGKYTFDDIELTDTDDVLDEGNVFFSMMFIEANRSHALCFKAIDEDGNIYVGTKAAPEVGFQNSKYYYGEVTLDKLFMPTIVITDQSGSMTPEPSENQWYSLDVDSNQTATISGISKGFRVSARSYGQIVFDNFTATSDKFFLHTYNSATRIKLIGDNTITCNDNRAVDCDEILRLSCDGEQATLTVKVSANTYKGLLASNYNGDDNPLALAAPGYVVELDNADPDPVDGMYTYVYTVKPSPSNIIDLQYLLEDYTVPTGMTLTGELIGKYMISIADGATVTLSGVTIDGIDDGNHFFAGISCLGSATLILADGTTNNVKGFNKGYPGIHVPNEKTLTINGDTQGTGELNASSNGGAAGIGGGVNASCGSIIINGGHITASASGWGFDGFAGIGGNYCGDITINGGTVVASGGYMGAGIGANQYGSCGNITINGGDVTATSEGYSGIGAASYSSRCGNITISADVIKVTATRGDDGSNIGPGQGSCGIITFGSGDGSQVYDGSAWSPNPLVAGDYGGLTLAITTTTVDEHDIVTWTLTPTPTE